MRTVTCRVNQLEVCLVVLIALTAACAAVPESPAPTAPYFLAVPGDFERYQSLARAREREFETCGKQPSCARAHFIRALVALFEDRELARNHFERAMDFSPGSKVAASSELWIKSIQDQQATEARSRFFDAYRDQNGRHPAGAAVTRQLVQDLLDREILIDRLIEKEGASEASVADLQGRLRERDLTIVRLRKERERLQAQSPSIKRLEDELAERDLRIQKLNDQLEALMSIDRE